MRTFISVFLLFFFIHISGIPCTTAVVSGKYTKDGRPLLWKNRDTQALNNKVMKFNDGKYLYTGVINSSDTLGKSIWQGFNSAGFAIMNSASYNLNNDTIKQSGTEGRLMKLALQTCATVDDFEELLKGLDKPTRLEANYGVIDASGGAAYFELGNFGYKKIDVNDPKIAPYGYVIRTNYSVTGKMGIGGGYIRFVTADKMMKMAVKENRLTPETIIREGTRNLTHSLTHMNLEDYSNIPANHETMIYFEDFIPRRLTSSSTVVQGVKKGEDPAYTTMWTVLGWPLTSVTIPVWLSKKAELPHIMQYDKNLKDSPLCHMALTAKKRCFPYTWGTSSKHYMNVNGLINADKTGTIQLIHPFEDKIFAKAEALLNSWREQKISQSEMTAFYKWIDQKVPEFYKNTFGIE